MTPAGQVRIFHEAFGLPVGKPDAIPGCVGGLPQEMARLELLTEEFHEYTESVLERQGLPRIAQELADVVIVAYGTALVYGFDLDAVITEVMAANMRKLDADGRPIRRADGKILKPDGWLPPDIAQVISGGHGGRGAISSSDRYMVEAADS